jgi:hypothetical protein
VTDELNQSEETEETPAETPVVQTPDLEALVRDALEKTLKGELDTRFSGLQSIQDKRLRQIAKELKESNLTQGEQDAILEQEQEQDSQKALQIAELIKRRKTAPEAVEFLLESMDKADLDDQIEFIQSVLKPSQKPETPAPTLSADSDEEGEIPETNKTNPASQRNAALESGDEMNDELADAVLDQVGKGQFSRFFRRGA